MNPRRRWYDHNRWTRPVTKRNLVVAFLAVFACFGGTIAYGLSVQSQIRSNQCENMNRLAETKLVLRDLLRVVNSGPDNAESVASETFQASEDHLSVGIVELERRINRQEDCALFKYLKDRAP